MRRAARTRVGAWAAATLVAAAVPIVAAGAAHAAGAGGNLLANPGAEQGTGSTDPACGAGGTVPGWTATTTRGIGHGAVTAEAYGTGSYPDATVAASINGGSNLFTGACLDTASSFQVVDLSANAADIDAGHIQATLAADLGGYLTQEDAGQVTAKLYGADLASDPLATLTIGPVTAEDRNGITELLPRQAQQVLPAGTRQAVVELTFTRASGTANDGYADNISLSLTDTTKVQHTVTVTTAGDGTGHVNGDLAPALSCPGQCTQSYDSSATTTLTATPGPDSAFTGWGGDCSGTSPTCVLAVSADRTVTATFTHVALQSTAPPTVVGVPKAGHLLTCSPGGWTDSPTFSYAWEWRQQSVAVPFRHARKARYVGVHRHRISKAHAVELNHTALLGTGPYLIVPDVATPHAIIVCAVAAQSPGGQRAAASASTGPLQTDPPILGGPKHQGAPPPHVTPRVAVGAVNLCLPGAWDHHPGTFSFAWYRFLRIAQNGRSLPIRRLLHRGQEFTATLADEDHTVGCVVTARNPAGSTEAKSNTYVVPAVAANATSIPSVAIDAQHPDAHGEAVTSGEAIAEQVTLDCGDATWDRTDIHVQKHWVLMFSDGTATPLPGALSGADRGLGRFTLDMRPGKVGWDITVACDETATTSHGATSDVLSGPIHLWNGCIEQQVYVDADGRSLPGDALLDGAVYVATGPGALGYDLAGNAFATLSGGAFQTTSDLIGSLFNAPPGKMTEVYTYGPNCRDYQKYWEGQGFTVKQQDGLPAPA